MWFPAGMANILGDEQRQQILALGRLGWALRRIEQALGVRREPASDASTDVSAGFGPVAPSGVWPPRSPRGLHGPAPASPIGS